MLDSVCGYWLWVLFVGRPSLSFYFLAVTR
nr:MAG TPA: hypothetical protein [Caudoviricetes sp.]